MKTLELCISQNIAEKVAAGQQQQVVCPFSWGGGTPIPSRGDTLRFCVNGTVPVKGSFTCSGSWLIELRKTRTGTRKMKITGSGAGELGNVAVANGFKNSDEFFAWASRELGLPFNGFLVRWTN